jgi:hypothetical protein
MMASVNKWTQSLCEEIDMRNQGTRINIQVAKMPEEVTCKEFNM